MKVDRKVAKFVTKFMDKNANGKLSSKAPVSILLGRWELCLCPRYFDLCVEKLQGVLASEAYRPGPTHGEVRGGERGQPVRHQHLPSNPPRRHLLGSPDTDEIHRVA